MEIAGALFDYELGEADLMRRAVSKKKPADLNLHRCDFPVSADLKTASRRRPLKKSST